MQHPGELHRTEKAGALRTPVKSKWKEGRKKKQSTTKRSIKSKEIPPPNKLIRTKIYRIFTQMLTRDHYRVQVKVFRLPMIMSCHVKMEISAQHHMNNSNHVRWPFKI